MLSRLHRNEDGIALVLVLGVSAMLLLIVTASLAFARNSTTQAHLEQDAAGALAAAQAGIDDYLFRLNLDNEYLLYDADNPPSDGNRAFTEFVPVPGERSEGWFTYSVDTSTLPSTGGVSLTSTGLVGRETRSISALIRRDSFLEFIYFTDYETLPPIAYTGCRTVYVPDQSGNRNLCNNELRAWAEVHCSHHQYETWTTPGGRTRTGREDGCYEIFFANNDVVDGPFHTNDIWVTQNGPTWRDAASGSNPFASSPSQLYDHRGGDSPKFLGGPPFYQPARVMPPSNEEIRVEADHTVGNEGCLYTGPTRITLKPNGRMDVVSPFTVSTGPGCAPGNDLQYPSNGVIFVQSVPGSPSDPNYRANCGGHPLGLPRSNDVTTYDCKAGDVFVQGTVVGRLTIAAENDVVITGHVRYTDDSPEGDLLGLIANQFVKVYHPVNSSGSNLTAQPFGSSTLNDLDIDAAMLSVNHSFIVPAWDQGNRLGDLNVFGSIAQIYRGPVGTFSGGTSVSGYNKQYVYDYRLQYLSPPHFIDPVAAEWRARRWSEISVDADGLPPLPDRSDPGGGVDPGDDTTGL